MEAISSHSHRTRINEDQLQPGNNRSTPDDQGEVEATTRASRLRPTTSESVDALSKAAGSDTVARKNARWSVWDKLKAQSEKISHQYSDNMRCNLSKVKCLLRGMVKVRTGHDAQNEMPIHANEIMFPASGTQQKAETKTYLAGQSPDALFECENMLVQGLESGQGVFQFVSRKAHGSPDESRENPIIRQLRKKLADNGPNFTLGDGRYQFKELKQSSAASDRDYLTCQLTVTDIKTGNVHTVPLTQAGLKFTDSVLRVDQISRASEILTRHQQLISQDRDGVTGQNAQPLIVSYAGIGRNATLISYTQLCAQIESGEVSETTLDAALEEVILKGREARGPKFVQSDAQLDELRTALLAKCKEHPRQVQAKPTRQSELASINAGKRPVESTPRPDDSLPIESPVNASEPPSTEKIISVNALAARYTEHMQEAHRKFAQRHADLFNGEQGMAYRNAIENVQNDELASALRSQPHQAPSDPTRMTKNRGPGLPLHSQPSAASIDRAEQPVKRRSVAGIAKPLLPDLTTRDLTSLGKSLAEQASEKLRNKHLSSTDGDTHQARALPAEPIRNSVTPSEADEAQSDARALQAGTLKRRPSLAKEAPPLTTNPAAVPSTAAVARAAVLASDDGEQIRNYLQGIENEFLYKLSFDSSEQYKRALTIAKEHLEQRCIALLEANEPLTPDQREMILRPERHLEELAASMVDEGPTDDDRHAITAAERHVLSYQALVEIDHPLAAFAPQRFVRLVNHGRGDCLFHALEGTASKPNLSPDEVKKIRADVASIRAAQPDTELSRLANGHARNTLLRLHSEDAVRFEEISNRDFANDYQKKPGIYAGDMELQQWLELPANQGKTVSVVDGQVGTLTTFTRGSNRVTAAAAFSGMDAANDAIRVTLGDALADVNKDHPTHLALYRSATHWERIMGFPG